jgi:uncharacterized Zn finger protein (UPF0148 family)
MSDDFDKEAEREKLRKKYEHDQKKREATEQMSELLLQGATMTNTHCSECSNPIFRYEDQEFCPTCEKPVNRNQNPEKKEQSDDLIQVADPSEDAKVSFGSEKVEANQDSSKVEQTNDTALTKGKDNQRNASEQERQSSQSQQPPRQLRQSQETDDGPSQRKVPNKIEGNMSGVESARKALEQSLVRFSQQAAAIEDPQRAQEYLVAAREAAEALAALRK